MAEFDPTQFGAVAVDEPKEFDPTQHGAIPVQHEEPSALQKTGRAVVDTLKGFLPQSVEDVALAPITSFPGVGQAYKSLANIAFGRPASEGISPLQGIPVAQRIPQIIEAEKTPAGSQERYTTGAGVVADLAMLAGFKGALEIPKLSEVAGITKPETPMAAAVEPVPLVETPPVTEVQPTAPTEIKGEPNAVEPSNAQIQTGETPLSVEERTGSEIPRTSDSNNVIREAQGTAEPREIPARQGTQAGQEVVPTISATEEANQLYPNDPFRQYVHRGLSENEAAQLLREENSEQPDWSKIRELRSKFSPVPEAEAAPKVEIPPDAKATVQFKTDTGEYVSREMNAKEAEGIFTKERSSYKALIDCLGR